MQVSSTKTVTCKLSEQEAREFERWATAEGCATASQAVSLAISLALKQHRKYLQETIALVGRLQRRAHSKIQRWIVLHDPHIPVHDKHRRDRMPDERLSI